jgi:hypothetical protein
MDINSIATKQDLKDLWDKIAQMFSEKFSQLDGIEKTERKQAYLRSRDVMELLNISDNKLRDMRNSREIPFSLIGKTYYYKTSEIHKLMDKHMRAPNDPSK